MIKKEEINIKIITEHSNSFFWDSYSGDIEIYFEDTPLGAASIIVESKDDLIILDLKNSSLLYSSNSVINIPGFSKMSAYFRLSIIRIFKEMHKVGIPLKSVYKIDKQIGIEFYSYKYKFDLIFFEDDMSDNCLILDLKIHSTNPNVGPSSYLMFSDSFILDVNSLNLFIKDIINFTKIDIIKLEVENKSYLSSQNDAAVVENGALTLIKDGDKYTQHLSTNGFFTELYKRYPYPETVFKNLVLIKLFNKSSNED